MSAAVHRITDTHTPIQPPENNWTSGDFFGHNAPMYRAFFNLTDAPFNITPNPRYLLMTQHHREAYNALIYGIQQRKGFIQLTGEVGSGKTTLCRAVLDYLGKSVDTALILNPSLTETQLLRAILHDFGIEAKGRDRLAYIEKLNEFLLQRTSEGMNVALLIDEAQNLSPQVMEQVRLLSNLETDSHKLIQIVLAGQPELDQRLSSPELRQLRQRITVRYHLPALTESEVSAYIFHRLKTAGAKESGVQFADKAIDAIFKYSRGIPRMINAVCDSALMAAYVANTRIVDLPCVRRAIQHLEGKSS
jgi:general secretion pathway protein A